jgi:hypothetical protein
MTIMDHSKLAEQGIMLDPKLVARGVKLLENPPQLTEAAKRLMFAEIVSGSHQLEGMEHASFEEVLRDADAYAAKKHVAKTLAS